MWFERLIFQVTIALKKIDVIVTAKTSANTIVQFPELVVLSRRIYAKISL